MPVDTPFYFIHFFKALSNMNHFLMTMIESAFADFELNVISPKIMRTRNKHPINRKKFKTKVQTEPSIYLKTVNIWFFLESFMLTTNWTRKKNSARETMIIVAAKKKWNDDDARDFWFSFSSISLFIYFLEMSRVHEIHARFQFGSFSRRVIASETAR
jgi:hypothetical protein